ncbi:phenylalanine--tRNA ligase beta subunit-related protein [Modestobacter versicolor]|uniref:phenylalanine--tRNA ligase beta subunit-related protein n=1 Tax=Modestobacter versicolor TaxID=429133 RepID=UPI0034DE9BE4
MNAPARATTTPGTPGTPGVDVPDARGRTGLDRVGRHVTGNPDVRVVDVEVLAAAWHVLRRTTLEVRGRDGHWRTQQRETYDRGNGATVLLYDAERRTVLLARQFRWPVYVNGHPDGLLLETAAGLLDDDDPATAIRREAAEELGVVVGELEPVFEVWMSPGSVTERLSFFAAPYSPGSRTGAGGGLADEGEDIEVCELPFDEALGRVADGRIADAKTIMLLQWAALSGPFAAPRGPLTRGSHEGTATMPLVQPSGADHGPQQSGAGRAPDDPRAWLAAASVDPAVVALRPDYRALLVTADGLRGGPSDEVSEGVLAAAEDVARRSLAGRPPEQLPHLAAWREAYRAFGAKPQRTRPSVEALLRRLDTGGLPRVDRLTDVYNAVSIAHLLPLGGEDRDAYAGPPRLVRATGQEDFDTTAGGEPVVEHPDAGEVVWRDDVGVTCRRWNWRQCVRTRIEAGTTRAVFVLDALDPLTDDALDAAADALTAALLALSPDAVVHRDRPPTR